MAWFSSINTNYQGELSERLEFLYEFANYQGELWERFKLLDEFANKRNISHSLAAKLLAKAEGESCLKGISVIIDVKISSNNAVEDSNLADDLIIKSPEVLRDCIYQLSHDKPKLSFDREHFDNSIEILIQLAFKFCVKDKSGYCSFKQFMFIVVFLSEFKDIDSLKSLMQYVESSDYEALKSFASKYKFTIDEAATRLAKDQGSFDIVNKIAANQNISIAKAFYEYKARQKKIQTFTQYIQEYNAKHKAELNDRKEQQMNSTNSNNLADINNLTQTQKAIEELLEKRFDFDNSHKNYSNTTFRIFGNSSDNAMFPKTLTETIQEIISMLKEINQTAKTSDLQPLIDLAIELDSETTKDISSDIQTLFKQFSNLETYLNKKLDKLDRILSKSIDFDTYSQTDKALINKIKSIQEILHNIFISINIDEGETTRVKKRAYMRSITTAKNAIKQIEELLDGTDLREPIPETIKQDDGKRYADNPFMGRV